MLSAVISSAYSYPAMRLASQPVHQGCVHSGPLVLGAAPVKSPAPTADRAQTVSRRFEPSSRTTLNCEQPYAWDRLHSNCLTCTVPDPFKGPRLEPQRRQDGISTLAPPSLATRLQSLPAILHRQRHSPMQSYSKGSWGLSV